jgi:uncharacterized small protein (DUF1192 family)
MGVSRFGAGQLPTTGFRQHIGWPIEHGKPQWEHTMPAMDEDDRPKKKLVHEVGQDLTLLSVKELDERVMLLKEEIARLEADKVKKQAQRSAADQFFKR